MPKKKEIEFTPNPKSKKSKRKLQSESDYIIMTDKGEFFSGFEKGYFKFSFDINDAKPIYDDPSLHKFEMMKRHLSNDNIIYDFIN